MEQGGVAHCRILTKLGPPYSVGRVGATTDAWNGGGTWYRVGNGAASRRYAVCFFS